MLNHTKTARMSNAHFVFLFIFFNQENHIENIKQMNTVKALAIGTAGGSCFSPAVHGWASLFWSSQMSRQHFLTSLSFAYILNKFYSTNQ